MNIVTSETRARTAAPTAFGMNPAIAEHYQGLGIDPVDFAEGIRQRAARETEIRLAREREAAVMLAAGGNALELGLEPADVETQNALLNKAALAYMPDGFISEEVAPVQMVDAYSGKYIISSREDQYDVPDPRIGPNGTAKELSPSLSTQIFYLTDFAFQEFVPNAVDAANPSLRLKAGATERTKDALMLDRERRVISKFMTAANYPASNKKTLGASANWNGGSAADPIADMQGAILALPAPPTHSIMSTPVWHSAQANAALKAILASQLTNQGLLRLADFSLYFGVPNLRIIRRQHRNAAGSLVSMWTDADMWIGTIDQNEDRLTFARTFRLRQGAGGFVTSQWFDPKPGTQGGTSVKVAYTESVEIVAADYGYLLSAVKQ